MLRAIADGVELEVGGESTIPTVGADAGDTGLVTTGEQKTLAIEVCSSFSSTGAHRVLFGQVRDQYRMRSVTWS